jgi:hypothetical protein
LCLKSDGEQFYDYECVKGKCCKCGSTKKHSYQIVQGNPREKNLDLEQVGIHDSGREEEALVVNEEGN